MFSFIHMISTVIEILCLIKYILLFSYYVAKLLHMVDGNKIERKKKKKKNKTPERRDCCVPVSCFCVASNSWVHFDITFSSLSPTFGVLNLHTFPPQIASVNFAQKKQQQRNERKRTQNCEANGGKKGILKLSHCFWFLYRLFVVVSYVANREYLRVCTIYGNQVVKKKKIKASASITLFLFHLKCCWIFFSPTRGRTMCCCCSRLRICIFSSLSTFL